MKKKVALLMWMLCWVTASAFAYEGEPFYYARQWCAAILCYMHSPLWIPRYWARIHYIRSRLILTQSDGNWSGFCRNSGMRRRKSF